MPLIETEGWVGSAGRSGLASVLLAAYNGGRVVEEALESVRRQTYRPIELVMVDDGSTDDTRSILQAWSELHESADMQCVVVSKPNGGLLSTRNAGVRHSSGEYIQFLDQDDVIHPRKLEICIRAIAESDADLAVAGMGEFAAFEQISVELSGEPQRQPWDLDWQRSKSRSHYARAYWGYLSPVFRRATVAAAGPFPEHLEISAAEEMEHHARVKLNHPTVVYLPILLAYHRKTPGSITHHTRRTVREGARAGHIVAHMLRAAGVRDRVEWMYLARFSLARLWRSIRHTRDPVAFLWSLRSFALSTRCLLMSHSSPA